MTAVVGILNKSAVALAADSAVTITGPNGKKIFNTANKIFTLSKYHPVGVMVYSSASFMNIPWEILIKSYREQLKERFFPSLKEYQEDFIQYLKNQVNIVSIASQEQYLVSIGTMFFKYFLDETLSEIEDDLISLTANKQTEKIKSTLEKNIRNKHYDHWINEEINDEFKDYMSLGDFFKSKQKALDNIYNLFYGTLNLDIDVKQMLYEILYYYIRSKRMAGNMTGLVFAGYGENEFFPSCIPIKIDGVIDNRIRFIVDENEGAYINDDLPAAICPFAQTDVIDAFIKGIHTELEGTYINSFRMFLEQYTLYLQQETQNAGFDLTAILNNVNHESMMEALSQNISQVIRSKHINPTIDTVSILSKEDLAEMAESLIYLTFMKRRISFAEESVGGPVDVAVISKGDGFIWIKRKHYFEPSLNYNFFSNYLKNQ